MCRWIHQMCMKLGVSFMKLCVCVLTKVQHIHVIVAHRSVPSTKHIDLPLLHHTRRVPDKTIKRELKRKLCLKCVFEIKNVRNAAMTCGSTNLTLSEGRVSRLSQWAGTRWRGWDQRCTVSHCSRRAPGLDKETPRPAQRVHPETYCSCGRPEGEPYPEPEGEERNRWWRTRGWINVVRIRIVQI